MMIMRKKNQMAPADANRLVVDTKVSLIYRRLKQDILDGRLEPGQKLAASRMAESYGVSVIPLREAFSLLIAEDLLANIPHKGTYVAEIDVDEIEEMNSIGAILEGYATREVCSHLEHEDLERLSELLAGMEQASQRGDYSEMSQLHHEFHFTIYRASHKERLVEFIELPDHAFFVATQAHPEFKSRLESPAPLFLGFVRACAGT